MQENWVRSLGWKDTLEKGKTTHSSIMDCRTVHGVTKNQTQLSNSHFTMLYFIVFPHTSLMYLLLDLVLCTLCIFCCYCKRCNFINCILTVCWWCKWVELIFLYWFYNQETWSTNSYQFPCRFFSVSYVENHITCEWWQVYFTLVNCTLYFIFLPHLARQNHSGSAEQKLWLWSS